MYESHRCIEEAGKSASNINSNCAYPAEEEKIKSSIDYCFEK